MSSGEVADGGEYLSVNSMVIGQAVRGQFGEQIAALGVRRGVVEALFEPAHRWGGPELRQLEDRR